MKISFKHLFFFPPKSLLASYLIFCSPFPLKHHKRNIFHYPEQFSCVSRL